MISKCRLVFLGAPGAGKGTFSAMLMKQYDLAHISTGEILRNEIASGSKLGQEADRIIKQGKLLSDTVVSAIVKQRLRQPDCQKGFILDGFPRTVCQAVMLEQIMQEISSALDVVIYFKVDDELLIKRLAGRISCPVCGAIFNRYFCPPAVDMVCDNCGSTLQQRSDDTEETVRKRLTVFHKQTEPLIEYYQKNGLLQTITQTEQQAIFNTLLELLK